MKIIFSLLLTSVIITAISFRSHNEEKKYKVDLTQAEWISYYSSVMQAAQSIKQSDIPSKLGIPLSDSLTKFANLIAAQLQPQFQADQQPKKDSVKKK